MHTESTERIEGPNGVGSIETVSVSVNGVPSTATAAPLPLCSSMQHTSSNSSSAVPPKASCCARSSELAPCPPAGCCAAVPYRLLTHRPRWLPLKQIQLSLVPPAQLGVIIQMVVVMVPRRWQ